MGRITLRSVVLLAVCILVPLVSGAAVGILTTSGVTGWYTEPQQTLVHATQLRVRSGLDRSLHPDGDLPVPCYYSGMGKRNREDRNCPVCRPVGGKPPVVPALLRAAFSPASLACILVLLALIVATIITFSRLSKPAAVLLVPYLAWVCIATALNAGVVLLN